MMPTVTWGMSTLEKHHAADGTSLITSLRTIAGAFGGALFMSVMTMCAGGDPDSGHDSRHGYGLLGHVAFGGGADGDGGVWDRNPKLIPFGAFGHTIGFVVVSGGFF